MEEEPGPRREIHSALSPSPLQTRVEAVEIRYAGSRGLAKGHDGSRARAQWLPLSTSQWTIRRSLDG
jgi:hypothetical protein